MPDSIGSEKHVCQLPIQKARGRAHPSSRAWASIVKLYGRPWFGRLWVVQEAALAGDLVLVCGKKQISWELFIAFTSISITSFCTVLANTPSLQSAPYHQSMYQAVAEID
jgi:hypothetical protein